MIICSEIRRLAYFYLDGAVATAKAASIETHIERCPDCGMRFVIHRRLREAVRVRLKPLSAPEGLRDRIRKTCRG